MVKNNDITYLGLCCAGIEFWKVSKIICKYIFEYCKIILKKVKKCTNIMTNANDANILNYYHLNLFLAVCICYLTLHDYLNPRWWEYFLSDGTNFQIRKESVQEWILIATSSWSMYERSILSCYKVPICWKWDQSETVCRLWCHRHWSSEATHGTFCYRWREDGWLPSEMSQYTFLPSAREFFMAKPVQLKYKVNLICCRSPL